MLFKIVSAKSLFAFWLMVTLAAGAQTSDDLAAKYSPIAAFEVRPGILMTARYAGDGQVCEMILEKRHRTATKTDLGSAMSRELVKQLIDELVPSVERGQQTKKFYKWDYETTISGNIAHTQADYENVSIEITGSLAPGDSGDVVVVIHWKKRTCLGAKPHHQAAIRPPR